MKPTQDPKYGINKEGQICNIETGIPIPENEPVFMLRAKDILAAQVISYYENLVPAAEHKQAVLSRINDFKMFARAYPEAMKAPDTAFPFPKIK